MPMVTWSSMAALDQLTLFRLARDAFQEAPDLAVLLALAVGPFANHLLLGPHVRDQRLDGFGETGHRRGGAAAGGAFLEHDAQPLDRGLELAARNAAARCDGHLAAAIFAHGGGEPVFEVGVEAVLRLARLQVEEAEDQRAGEAKQRARKRDAHAAERRGEALLQRVEQRTGITPDLQAVDDRADRADRLDQAPEGAEQAEEDQKPR